jgi:hypothetical protein
MAWHAEALVAADAELQESNNATLRRVRKLFENLRSLSGPLSLPSLDCVPTSSDPIFAVIEARRRAYADYEKAGGAPARRPGKNQQARIRIGDYAGRDHSNVEDGQRLQKTDACHCA